MIYIANHTIRHNKKTYERGMEVAGIAEKDLQALIEAKAIRQVGDKPAPEPDKKEEKAALKKANAKAAELTKSLSEAEATIADLTAKLAETEKAAKAQVG